MKKAVVILSGGLDSTTCMGLAQQQGYELYPLTFFYGQRHSREVEQAKKVAAYYKVPQHRIVNLDFLGQIGGSALTDERIDVPEPDGDEEGIPVTYVPARNLIFLSVATAYAEVVGAEIVYIGVSAVDYSGYPDCRPEFIASMNDTINKATKTGVESTGPANSSGPPGPASADNPSSPGGGGIHIEAPLAHLSKAETIQAGIKAGVPYELTTSCYKGGEVACGLCDSCRLRLEGFRQAGYADPIAYANQ